MISLISQQVLGWLGGNQELLAEAYLQSITSVHNRYTNEQTFFNPLRAKRPISQPELPEKQ